MDFVISGKTAPSETSTEQFRMARLVLFQTPINPQTQSINSTQNDARFFDIPTMHLLELQYQ